jgi:hypothetical protein
VPKGLFDDLYLPLTVLLKGSRVVRAPELKAFERHTTSGADEFRRKIRIACECMAVHATLWPRLKTLDGWHLYKYVMSRLMRWIGGWLMVAGAVLLAIAAGSSSAGSPPWSSARSVRQDSGWRSTFACARPNSSGTCSSPSPATPSAPGGRCGADGP